MALFAVSTSALMYVIKLLIDAASTLQDQGAQIGINPDQNSDQNTGQSTGQYAKIILPILFGVAITTSLSDFFQRILTNSIALNTVAKFQKQMLRAVHQRDFASFAKEPSGQLISKFTYDVKVISDALMRVISNLFKESLSVIFTLAGMLYFNWLLTCVLAIFLLAMWPIITLSKRMRGSASHVQAHSGRLTAALKQSFTSAQFIKSYGLEDYENARLGKEFDRRIALFLKLVTQQAWVEPILTLFGGMAIAGIFIFGFWQVSQGMATAGSVAAVLTGVMILSPRLRALGTLNNAIQEGLSALTRIFDVIDETPVITDSIDAINLADARGDIELGEVHFAYDDGTKALRGLSLSAKSGETIALIGPSGGGKSTIINLISRLYEVQSGSIKIDGVDIRGISLESLRANIALVSQDVTLFNDTITANISLGDLSANQDKIRAAAMAADAHDFIQELPEGYDTMLGEDGAGLSGGQKQRLAIARAILRDAPILLLDEATSALDAASESKVQAALERLSQGRTKIVIAHKLSTVKKADKIYVVEDGQIAESGTHATLSKKRGGVYKGLKDLQG